MCLEDKMDLASEKAMDEFESYLRREPSKPNEYMKAGIEFEKDCYEGKTCVSPIIEGGAFQIVGKKKVEVSGRKFLMYGRLDVLKGGVIYDIKRVVKYSAQKYLHSAQHGFYLDLFPRANRFEYLAYDGAKLHVETYYRGQYRPTVGVIADFVSWLSERPELMREYEEKWKAKGE